MSAATTAFTRFVERQQSPDETGPDFYITQREEWLSWLNQLHSHVEAFLKEYIERGEIEVIYNPVELLEDDIGTYVANQMTLRIGRKRVTLDPVGTLLIGSKGRVDVRGPAGSGQLLLVNEVHKGASDMIKFRVHIHKEGEKLPSAPLHEENVPPVAWAWRILSRDAKFRFCELTKESFFDLLMEVANA